MLFSLFNIWEALNIIEKLTFCSFSLVDSPRRILQKSTVESTNRLLFQTKALHKFDAFFKVH